MNLNVYIDGACEPVNPGGTATYLQQPLAVKKVNLSGAPLAKLSLTRGFCRILFVAAWRDLSSI